VLNRLAALIAKEIRQFTRDRVLMFFSLLGPAIQIVLLGYSISQDIVDIPVAIIDYDVSALSREIATALDNTRELSVAYFPENLAAAQDLIDRGEAMALVVIPDGFMAKVGNPNRIPQIQVIVDGVSSLVAARTVGAAQGAIQSLVESAAAASNQPPPGGIRIYAEALFNRAMDLRPDAQTSQLGLITFEITMVVAVMGIVREREIGTLEMLTITPLRQLEIIAGKALTPLLIGTINFLTMLIVTRFAFHIPLRGSFGVLLGMTVVYLMCEVAFALLISTIARSQQQATTVVFVWAMCALTLSGYLVPISTLPKAMQWMSWFIPLRHYLTVLRSVMLKGSGLAQMIPDALALGALAAGMVLITTRTLRRVFD
jgi:ABC-2 type transport system permease protein